jgi:cytochrome c556
MKFKSLATAALALSAALVGVSAAADTLKFGKTEDAIKYRQNSLFLISQHFGSLGAMANGRAEFNAEVAKQNGAVLETLAALPWQAFGAGAEGGKAKPEAWSEKTKFDEHVNKFVAEAGKLAAAAKTGDVAQLKAAFGPAAQTCKACHDAFRNR